MKSKYSGEFNFEGDEGIDFTSYLEENLKSVREVRSRQKNVQSVNEVGTIPTPPPEIMEERAKYEADLVLSLQEVFPESTGLKPFGHVQTESTKFMHYVMQKGGRLILLEPRGYAKTTRITNSALMATLAGLHQYIVIVASSLKKAQDILEDIRTELTTNEDLIRMYPRVCACFRHLARSPQKSKRQTYNGHFTYIQNTMESIHFPVIPDEASSGCIIAVRPATNLKGLKYKVEGGPNKGKAVRPTLYIFDDPQTEDEAESATSVRKIIKNIKRSALKGGTHQRPVSAIMAITPVEYGDVAWHFVTNEDSWDLVRYKMVEKWPDDESLWYGEYAEIRGKFNREVRGDRTRARKEASRFVKEHYDEMHKGHIVSWEHAFNSGDPDYEVSALQHAYNIILDDGEEDFEYECQCNIEYGLYEEGDLMHCPPDVIMDKTNNLTRRQVPQEATTIVTHIDVNKEILTYATLATGQNFRPFVIDYGTYPEQPGRFSKKKLTRELKTLYRDLSDHREILYKGVQDLIQFLAQMEYIREDGNKRHNNVIGVDIRYEEVYLTRACKESPYSNIIMPCWGTYIGPDDPLLHERKWPEGVQVYDNCIQKPNRDYSTDILQIDVNYFKTEVHRALSKDMGLHGSMTLFKGNHLLYAEHCNIEYPKRVVGKKTDTTRIQWYAKTSQPDNEFFDNTTACLALFSQQGIDVSYKESSPKVPRIIQKIDSVEDLNDLETLDGLW